MAKIKRSPRFKSAIGKGSGIGAQRVRASVRAIIGASKNRMGEEVDGRTGSFMKSFSPSAIGCRRPYGPTTLGPLRSCIYPRTFRSTRVRRATARRTKIIRIRG